MDRINVAAGALRPGDRASIVADGPMMVVEAAAHCCGAGAGEVVIGLGDVTAMVLRAGREERGA